MMNTHKITNFQLDKQKLANDLQKVKNFLFGSTYSEFICGVWESCALWSRDGLPDKASVTQYEGSAQQTPYGHAMPYVSDFVEKIFHLHHLKLARLVRLKYNSVIIPHVDFLEVDQSFLRFHLPLQTDSNCFSSEDNLVYQMRVGEIWYLNASLPHSAASFSKQDRLHLILDFDDVKDWSSILREPVERHGIPSENQYKRPDMDRRTESGIRALSSIVDERNFDDVLAILIKMHFLKNISIQDMYRLFFQVIEQADKPTLIERAQNLYAYCMQNRNIDYLKSA